MVEIGGVKDARLVRDRLWVSNLQVFSPEQASANGYHTKWPAMVPEVPSRRPTQEELVSLTTPDTTSRQNVIFIRVEPSGIETIKAQGLEAFATIPFGERPLIPLAPGVDAYLRNVVPSPPNLKTTAVTGKSDNPDSTFPDGAYVGMHFDVENYLPVATRLEDSRRLIVNLAHEPRKVLFIASQSVVDVAKELYPGDEAYVPTPTDILPRLAQNAENQIVVWVLLKPGEGYVIPANDVIHDGSTYEQGESEIAVLIEPEQRWKPEDLLKHSLFHR